MPIAPTAQVHPTALLSPEVEVAEGVQVGPFALFLSPNGIGKAAFVPLPAGEKLGVILGQNTLDLLGGAGQVPRDFGGIKQKHTFVSIRCHRWFIALPYCITVVSGKSVLVACHPLYRFMQASIPW